MAKSTKKTRNNKRFVDFRIPKMPKDLYKKIIDHQNTRMIGKKSRPDAAMNLMETGLKFIENPISSEV